MSDIQILIDKLDKTMVELSTQYCNKKEILLKNAAYMFYMPKWVIRNSMYEDSTDSFFFLDDTDNILRFEKYYE